MSQSGDLQGQWSHPIRVLQGLVDTPNCVAMSLMGTIFRIKMEVAYCVSNVALTISLLCILPNGRRDLPLTYILIEQGRGGGGLFRGGPKGG